MYNKKDSFFQTGSAVAATLTAKWSTNAKLYAGDPTCSEADHEVKLLTCSAMKTASSVDAHHPFCNDAVDHDHDDDVVDNEGGSIWMMFI